MQRNGLCQFFNMSTTKKDKEFLWLKVLHQIDDVDAFMNMWYYNDFFVKKTLIFNVRFATKEDFNRLMRSSVYLNRLGLKEGEIYLTHDERPILKKHTKPFRNNC